jgi:hypothetical protein
MAHKKKTDKVVYNQKRYLENKEEYLKKAQDYYLKNRAKVKKASLEWGKKHPDKKKKSCDNWKKNNKEKTYGYKLKNKYGMTTEDYNSMFDGQGGRCAICGEHQSLMQGKLGVDHDHDTGIVRGLLCPRCNMAIGLLHDSVDIILSAANYLGASNE